MASLPTQEQNQSDVAITTSAGSTASDAEVNELAVLGGGAYSILPSLVLFSANYKTRNSIYARKKKPTENHRTA